ncbi:hypothetical protein OXX80_008689 [Metschnikowia pulcherrima]
MDISTALEGLDDDAFQIAHPAKKIISEEEIFSSRILEKRQRRAMAAKIARSKSKNVPFKDTVESFRSVPPDHFKAKARDNEWQRAGGKRCRKFSIDDCDLDFDAMTNSVLGEVANLAAGPIFV